MKQFTKEEAVAKNRARFVNAVISGEINLQRTSGGALPRVELESSLRELKFDPLLPSGDFETAEKDIPATSGYGYLLDMSIHSLTLERGQQLQKKALEAANDLANMKRCSREDLWKTDLQTLGDKVSMEQKNESI